MKKRLLAMAVSICMMAASCIPAFAAETTAKEIKNADELAAAIAAQKDNEVWNLAAGEYVLTQEHLNLYKDVQPGTSGQGNWYFPITKKVKIVGNGDVVLTSNVETQNGAWATQDFISVWADGVTIENVDIKAKKDINKAIEIMAKDFTLKDVTVIPQEAEDKTVNSGSVYFNINDAGTSKLENVTVSSWINAKAVTAGAVELKNVEIDFSNNTYASNAVFGVISGEKLVNNGLTVKVGKTIADLEAQVLTRVPKNTVIELTDDIALNKGIILTAEGITIDGKGHKITAAADFANNSQGQPNLFKVYNSKNVTLKNINFVSTAKTKHTLDVYTSENLVLENLTLNHKDAGIAGAPLINNASTITIKGKLNLVTGEKSWYGINVDNANGNASVAFAEGSKVALDDQSGKKLNVIFVEAKEGTPDAEKDAMVKNPENAGLVQSEDGTYREEVKATKVELDANEKTLTAGESFTLTATVTPENADNKTVAWTSSNAAVATVDENGKVTAVAAGTATITAKVGDVTATCTVTVEKAPDEKPVTPDETPSTPNADNNDTGVSNYFVLFALLAIISAGAIVFTKKASNK